MKSLQELSKNLKKDFSSLPIIKIGLLGDSSTQFLNIAIKGLGYDHSIHARLYESDFNQIEQQVYDEDSELYEFDPEFIIIFHSTPKLRDRFYITPQKERREFAEKHLADVENLALHLTKIKNKKVIYFNFPEINDSVFGNYSSKLEESFTFQLKKINFKLMELSCMLNDLFICDIQQLQNQFGFRAFFDPVFYVNASLAISLDHIPNVAKSVLDIILAIRGKIQKCIILDLDNTLWGGVIGDDGLEKIQVGNIGIGRAYSELQAWLKELKERGIILAVCSKNDESIAMSPFKNHPEMVLKMEDIAVFVANWENKAENIKYIQSVLNIGYDSMVFIDDNPYERNLVRSEITEITIPELPEDPVQYLHYLQQLNLFETASFSKEDKNRTSQYQSESKRRILEKSFTDPTSFLQSLKMLTQVIPFNEFSLPRIAQLSQRSNQFNLRTIRYTEEDLTNLIKSDNFYGCGFNLKDKFGDNGIISVIILEVRGPSVFIDTWIMSCRVLKRGMELFVLDYIVNFAREKGLNQIIGEYIPTQKNALVKDHYKKLGFQQDGQYWLLNINSHKPKPYYITLEN